MLFSGRVSDLPAKKTIHALTVDQPMSEALQTLFDKNILSAPVLDTQGNFLGQVDLMDAVVFLVYFSKQTQEILLQLGLLPEHKQVDFSGLSTEDKDIQKLFKAYDNTGSLKNFSKVNPTKIISQSSTVEELANLLAVNHRVGVLGDDGKLVNYLTQTDLLKFVTEKLTNVQLLELNRPVRSLQIGSSNIVTVMESTIVIEALKSMVTKRISSVIVVDSRGSFVSDFTPRDIREIELETQFLDRLVMPVADYLVLLKKPAVKTLKPESTLKEVITLLVKEKVHRVVILDNNNKAIRVISLGDLLRFLQQSHKSQ